MASNFDAAVKAEAKKVIRCFHRYDSEVRSDRAASFRLTQGQRASMGEYYYVHPAIAGVAFSKRFDAARAVVLGLYEPRLAERAA